MSRSKDWRIVSPESMAPNPSVKANPHPATLEGKTILLHWNSKHNGDLFLDRIAEMLVGKVKPLRVLKSWEIFPETAQVSSNLQNSAEIARKLSQLRPDIVIAAQAD